MADQTRNDMGGQKDAHEPRAEHAAAPPLVQMSSSLPRRRLTARELARRRRQRLLELLQHQGKPPAREEAVGVPAPSPAGSHACSSCTISS
jgi:hypothetical protein